VEGPDAVHTPRRDPPPLTRRIPAEVWEAHQAVRALLAEAEDQARSIRTEALRQADGVRAAAREAGLAEGLAGAAATVVQAAAERDRLLAACAEELLELAVEIAERILVREVHRGLDGVAAAARALALVRGSAKVILRASPDDEEALRAGGVCPGMGGSRVRLVVDPELGAGEVIVEADGAGVDGRFRAQLAELRRAIVQGEG
jgi:flagellar biosynthesis/type III secretory pathway protein FliH